MRDSNQGIDFNRHMAIKPSTLYFGTPVVLITTRNADGSANITPMSSAWALGDRVVLGLASTGQGAENLLRERECVLNLPSDASWAQVEGIARTTGRSPVPDYKARMGYEHAADKFALGGFTELASEVVRPPRILECPLQIETELVAAHEIPSEPVSYLIAETRALRVHAERDIVIPGTHHVDTGRWRPLFYVFRHYFGLSHDLGKTFRAEV